MRRYALTAEVMDAEIALALGLVHLVVEHDKLDDEVDTMLATLLAGSPQAQRATKALMAAVAKAPDSDETREHTCQVIAKLRVSQEGQEGLSSFFEKRRPVWADSNNTPHASERRS
jgi:methylglutaconyl-CoA hydratase